MKGKLIVIEGTNSSGKETQSNILVKRLNEKGIKSVKRRFPDYESPSGKIIKDNLIGNTPFGKEKDIPPKVAALYYAADRAYNIEKINKLLDDGVNVILDRYVESNMAYQAAKFDDIKDRINILLWMEQLEFTLLDLPRPDKVICLYLPYEFVSSKHLDEHHLKNIESAYGLMAERYSFDIINIVKNESIKTKEEISDEIFNIIYDYLVN